MKSVYGYQWRCKLRKTYFSSLAEETNRVLICAISSDVDECVNNAGMKKDVCTNGTCQNTMKDYICVCNAGFRSDVTKKLCNGKKQNCRFTSLDFVSAFSVLCLDR